MVESNKKPLTLDRKNDCYLNLGCGDITFEEFVNVDFGCNSKADLKADLRKTLPIDDNSVDGIFTEHTFEHLKYKHVDQLLKECYRIMKPGSIIRIIVPDISIFIKNYSSNNKTWFSNWERFMFIESQSEERKYRRIDTPIQAISFITQEYEHISCWDYETLELFMKRAGFSEIKQHSFMQGKNKKLLKDYDSESRSAISLYVEGIKPEKTESNNLVLGEKTFF